jgi:hypothetical protein
MINPREKRRLKRKYNSVSVWEEKTKDDKYLIYVGKKDTDTKTLFGIASCKESLEYKKRKARLKFRIVE